MQRENFNTQSVLNFLRELMTLLPRDLLILLDNSKPHKGAVEILEDEDTVEVLEEDDGSEEEHGETAPSGAVEFFPTYAPELNPDEYVWRRSKYDDLANYTPRSLDTLQPRVGRSLAAQIDHQEHLRSCVRQAKLEL